MAYGQWDLTTEEEKYFIPLFKYMIDELTCGRREEFDLTGKGINPYQARKVFEQLGYEEADMDENGWEQDRWVYFNKKIKADDNTYHFEETKLCLFYCGQTFEMKLWYQKYN